VEAVQVRLVLLVVVLLTVLVVQEVTEQPLVYLAHPSHTQVEAVVVDITHLLQQVALVVEEQGQEVMQPQQQEQLTQEAAVEAVAV
tara:strand:- start:84 stop:341 length:258 start_codon:yes stop_codon:yes gene_type:complete